MICLKRTGSPMTSAGTSGLMSLISSRPFWPARTASSFSASPTTLASEKGMDSRSSLRDSIFEKSRMSLRIVSSDSAEAFTVSRQSRWYGVSSVSRARLVMPMTPFIGVRISWLMFARNSDFALLAACAASLSEASVCSCPRMTAVCASTRRRRTKAHASAVTTAAIMAARSHSACVSVHQEALCRIRRLQARGEGGGSSGPPRLLPPTGPANFLGSTRTTPVTCTRLPGRIPLSPTTLALLSINALKVCLPARNVRTWSAPLLV